MFNKPMSVYTHIGVVLECHQFNVLDTGITEDANCRYYYYNWALSCWINNNKNILKIICRIIPFNTRRLITNLKTESLIFSKESTF